MMKRHIMAVAGLILAAASGACVVVVHDASSDTTNRLRSLEYKKSFPLGPGGTLSLVNEKGAVVIEGWEKSESQISAAPRYPEKVQVRFLGENDFDSAVRVREDQGDLRIRANKEEWSFSGLDYFIKVPRRVHLRKIQSGEGNVRIADVFGSIEVGIEEGDLDIKNFSGSLAATVDRGSVDAEILDLRTDDEIRIDAENGDIVLRLQKDASAVIEAEAPEGQITSEIPLSGELPARRIAGRIGNGQRASIILRSLKGDISIRVAP